MGLRLLLSHTIKIRPCALTFGLRKNRSDFFSELLATKNRSCALTQSEKNADLRSDFFSKLLTTKNWSVCAGHNGEKIHKTKF